MAKLMCVVAHPDDECVAFGGALILAAERGMETYVVCLTDGQAAANRGEAASGAELGRIRREEFAASCKILGVSRYELMDYQDARLEFVDFSKVAGQLVEKIRAFQPDIVITFGGDGGLNTHPDHMVVSCLATSAFHWAGRAKRYPELGAPFQAKRLYHLSTNFFLPDRQPPYPMPWTLTLEVAAVFDRKVLAFEQHASQAPLFEKLRPVWEQYRRTEVYTLMATSDPQAAKLSTDLFEGID